MEQPRPETHVPAIVVGWVLTGLFDEVDRAAIRLARSDVLRRLEEAFPAFEWRMPVVRRAELGQARRVEPVELLDAGVIERDANEWDFVFVVTAADLQSYFRPYALGAPAQSIDCAVLSTARLDPEMTEGDLPRDERIALLAHRIGALALHLFGHLNDAPHSEHPEDFMYEFRTVTDLDGMTRFSDETRKVLAEALAEAADLRIEEERGVPRGAFRFYLQTLTERREEIFSAVVQVRPWRFPFQFSKLTTAAVSTLIALMISAEAWDLGMSQPAAHVAALSVLALFGTSWYLIHKQNLILHRHARRLTEQHAVTALSVVFAIVLGMLTTYVLLFLTTVALGQTLFTSDVIAEWATSLHGEVGMAHYLSFAAFVAALGISIGALGASFEEQGYFRHVAYVDEET